MEIWTDLEFTMPTEKDYIVMEKFAKAFFDDKDHWPVEEYVPSERTIKIESVLATQDDAIEFATELLENIISKMAKGASGNMRGIIEGLSYTMHGHTDEGGYTECDYIIERNGNTLTMKESSFSHEVDFDDEGEDVYSYEEWCDNPDYGPVIDLKKKHEVVSLNDVIVEYLKSNNLPHDKDSVDKLSVEDVYDIMAGTFGKN